MAEEQRVYSAGDVARQLGISGAALRRLGVIYEGVHGDLPRDDRGRLWSEEAVERVRAARQAVQAGQVQSVDLALRQGVEPDEALPARKQPAEMMEELLGELRGLREAVERQNALLEDQGRRLEALEAPQEPQDQAEGAPPRSDRGTVPEEPETATEPPWWRRWFGG